MPIKRPRGRRNPPLMSANAEIVLPRPGAAVVLPPEAPPDTEHELEMPRAAMPKAATRRPTLEQLKLRARKIQTKQRALLKIWTRVDVATYEAIVELAEEYSLSMSEVHRQALTDGLRKYRDFRTPYAENPMRRTRVMESFPDLAEAAGPQSGAFAPGVVSQQRASVLADDLTGPVPELDELSVRRLGSFLPQTQPIVTPTNLAYDPIAPVAPGEPPDE